MHDHYDRSLHQHNSRLSNAFVDIYPFSQATIRKEFAECTIITIAHRINTILDYNKVMVLNSGKIQEFEDPQILLKDEKSAFFGLARDSGVVGGK